MSPTGTRVQIAIGAGWLVVGLYWFFWSLIISSSRVTLLLWVGCSLMAGFNAFMVYRRSSRWESRPAWLSVPNWTARPEPAEALGALEAPRINRVASPAQSPTPSPAPVTQPIPIRPAPAARPSAQPAGAPPLHEPQHRPEPEARPESDPEQKWRRPRHRRS